MNKSYVIHLLVITIAHAEALPGALLPSGDNSELYCKMNQDLTMLIQTYSLPFESMTNSSRQA